jgi:hypothetical protein
MAGDSAGISVEPAASRKPDNDPNRFAFVKVIADAALAVAKLTIKATAKRINFLPMEQLSLSSYHI